MKTNKELGSRIIELAERLMKIKASWDIAERQFFFNFWSLKYLTRLKKLKNIIAVEVGSLEEVCQLIQQESGIQLLEERYPKSYAILASTAKKYEITLMDMLQHTMGSLPLSGLDRR